MKPKLTPYEERIARLRIGGLSGREIAETVGRKHGTVRQDFMKVNEKLGIRLACQLPAAFAEYCLWRDGPPPPSPAPAPENKKQKTKWD